MNKLILPQEVRNGYKKIRTGQIGDLEINLDGLHHSVHIKDEPSVNEEDYLEEFKNGDEVDDDVVFLEELEIGNQVIIKDEMEDFEIELKDLHQGEATVNEDETPIIDKTELHRDFRTQFECRVCNLKYPNKLSLEEHSKIHKSNRCSYQDSFSKFLKGHIEEKSFACEMCSYTTSSAEHMRGHLQIHTTEFVPLNCDICGYKFSQENLQVQLLKKPFMCKISGIKCSRTANCRDRFTVCEPVAKPYACEQCDYRGSTAVSLNRHLQIHTREEQFECNICHYQFNKFGFLRKHWLTHVN